MKGLTLNQREQARLKVLNGEGVEDAGGGRAPEGQSFHRKDCIPGPSWEGLAAYRKEGAAALAPLGANLVWVWGFNATRRTCQIYDPAAPRLSDLTWGGVTHQP